MMNNASPHGVGATLRLFPLKVCTKHIEIGSFLVDSETRSLWTGIEFGKHITTLTNEKRVVIEQSDPTTPLICLFFFFD